MSLPHLTIAQVLEGLEFDRSTGRIFRMFQGKEDAQGPQEYELPLTDSYLDHPFDPSVEWPDFFAEDIEHFYFPVPPLPGETIQVCKTKRSTRQLLPFQNIKVRHGDEMIHLKFSRTLSVDVSEVVGDGGVVAYWREARVSAIADSVDAAMLRIGIHIANRLVESAEPSGYSVRSDILISRVLQEKGVNASVHFSEVAAEAAPPPGDISALLQDPSTDHTMLPAPFRFDKDPKYN